MTQEQVRASRGDPARIEQLTTTDAIWHYGGQRVMFANGRVIAVRGERAG